MKFIPSNLKCLETSVYCFSELIPKKSIYSMLFFLFVCLIKTSPDSFCDAMLKDIFFNLPLVDIANEKIFSNIGLDEREHISTD
eukprot:snap_masked-scaffold_81-processed-gene-0.28-mRNA-1 protein AED:1.00 eAED:1.00 QI:0/0/0/0/1/1/2/0/83